MLTKEYMKYQNFVKMGKIKMGEINVKVTTGSQYEKRSNRSKQILIYYYSF